MADLGRVFVPIAPDKKAAQRLRTPGNLYEADGPVFQAIRRSPTIMPIVAAVDQSERVESVISQARELADVYGVELHVVYDREQDDTRITTRAEWELERMGENTDTDSGIEEVARIARKVAQDAEEHGEFTAVGWSVIPLRNSSTTVNSTTPSALS